MKVDEHGRGWHCGYSGSLPRKGQERRRSLVNVSQVWIPPGSKGRTDGLCSEQVDLEQKEMSLRGNLEVRASPDGGWGPTGKEAAWEELGSAARCLVPRRCTEPWEPALIRRWVRSGPAPGWWSLRRVNFERTSLCTDTERQPNRQQQRFLVNTGKKLRG